MDRHLFVYGSLCAPAVFAAVTGLRRRPVPAELAGHRALRVRGQPYPMLVRAARDPGAAGVAVATGAARAEVARDSFVIGGLYRHLPRHALRRLDAFEGPWYGRVRVRVRVRVIGPGPHGGFSHGSGTDVLAFAYRSARSARVPLADEPWLLAPFLRTQARGFARYWRDRFRRSRHQRIC